MSFLFCTKAVASLARRTLFPAVLASMMVLGSQAASQAAVVISVSQEGGPYTWQSGESSLAIMNVTANLTDGTTPFDARGITFGLSWSTTTPGVTVTDLFTYSYLDNNAVKTPNISALNLVVNEAGMPWQTASSVTGVLSAGVNTNDLDPDFQRTAFVFQNNTASGNIPYPQITDGLLLAKVYMAVDASVSNATFTVDVMDTSDAASLYFINDTSGGSIAFTGQAGSVQVVPEPSTMASLFFVGLAATGFQVRRLRRKAA